MTIATSRALVLLESLAQSSEPISVPQLATATGLHRVTVARLVRALEDDGYITRDSAGRLRVSRKLWGLATAVVNADEVRSAAIPMMIELARSLRVWVSLAFLERDCVRYTNRIDSAGDRLMPVLINLAFPPVVTASGRILVALGPEEDWTRHTNAVPRLTSQTVTDPVVLRQQLEACRARGYAIVQSEQVAGICGFGFPLFHSDGQAVAALGLTVPGEPSPGQVQRLVAAGIPAAEAISADLGYRGPSRIAMG